MTRATCTTRAAGTGGATNTLAQSRKGQEKLPLDFLSLVLFVLIIAVFLIIANALQASRANSSHTDYALAQAHLQLLQFLKSDAGGEPMALFLDDGSPQEIAKRTSAAFDAKYGTGWAYTIHYSNPDRGDISDGSHSYSPQLALSVIKSIPLNYFNLGVSPVISNQVTVSQTLPARDGTTITITLKAWVLL